MTILEWRGGPPLPQNFAGITTTGVVDGHPLGRTREPNFRGTAKWLRIQNTGVEILHVFFTQEDFDDDINFVPLAIAGSGAEAILEGPIEATQVWFKAAANTTSASLMPLFRKG